VTATVVRERADLHADPAALFVSALADEIADRLATRLGPHLADLVEAGAIARPSQQATSAETVAAYDDGLWSAGRVAEHYDVAIRFVYQHADELGCLRLGGGVRPRLRFDPITVTERWPQVGGSLPETAPARRRAASTRASRKRPGRPRFELLDFDPEP